MSQAFARLGSKVTVVASRLLPREEPEVSAILEQVFKEENISVVKGRVESVDKNPDGSNTVTTSNGETIIGDSILVSIGRAPNTKGLGLEKVGVYVNGSHGGIQVNDKLETTCHGIYAAGDCTGDRQL